MLIVVIDRRFLAQTTIDRVRVAPDFDVVRIEVNGCAIAGAHGAFLGPCHSGQWKVLKEGPGTCVSELLVCGGELVEISLNAFQHEIGRASCRERVCQYV